MCRKESVEGEALELQGGPHIASQGHVTDPADAAGPSEPTVPVADATDALDSVLRALRNDRERASGLRSFWPTHFFRYTALVRGLGRHRTAVGGLPRTVHGGSGWFGGVGPLTVIFHATLAEADRTLADLEGALDRYLATVLGLLGLFLGLVGVFLGVLALLRA
jgi:hypothetical protein